MNRRGIQTSGIFFAVAFFIFTTNIVLAASNDIIINEIAAFPTSTHEWVEIFNKGTQPIDLLGWKFLTAASSEVSFVHHNLPNTGNTTLNPGEYGAICQDASVFLNDHPAFTGLTLDSSWSPSLKDDGSGVIGLQDNTGTIIEQFTYLAAPNHSLERRNPLLEDYTSANWHEHTTGDTVGSQNSNYDISDAPIPTTTPTSTTDTTTSTTDSTTTTTETTPTSTETIIVPWLLLKLNEFLPNPPTGGKEWVEFFNPASTSVNITGSLLCDSISSTSSCKTPTGTLPALGWLYFEIGGDSYLNNSGDSVIWKSPSGTIIDRIDYAGSLIPGENQSVARVIDGTDTDATSDWAITTNPTPGQGNTIVAPVAKSSNTSGGGGGTITKTPLAPTLAPTPTPKITTTTCSGTGCPEPQTGIFLNELYPNPPGSDLPEEFIEIKNFSDKNIDLSGWKLVNGNKTFSLFGSLMAQSMVAWPRITTKITLANTATETIRLQNPSGTIVDETTYHNAPEGQSYSRDTNNDWHWTSLVTRGLENRFTETPTKNASSTMELVWKLTTPRTADIGEMADFNAEDTADPRGGTIDMRWEFNDGVVLTGMEIERTFSTSGVFSATVFATSTSGAIGQRTFTIIVGNADIGDRDVVISEIFINPTGADNQEFIELFNPTSSTIDLSQYTLTYTTKEYTLPTETKIYPHGFLTFYRTVTRFSLSNAGGKISLLSPQKEIIDTARYGKAESGLSFALIDNEWHWVETPTPGKPPLLSETAFNSPLSTSLTRRVVVNFAKSLADARDLENKARVVVNGIVSVLPNIFGSQYFYISDTTGGIQVFFSRKDFPPLKIGDRVRITGERSASQGVERIKIKNKEDVDILSIENPLPITSVLADEIDADRAGSLATIVGEITEIKGSRIYLDDGQNEFVVVLKTGSRIVKETLHEGARVKITGIIEISGGTWSLLPRSPDDMVVLTKISSAPNTTSTSTPDQYTTATVSGMAALILGFVARARGIIVIGAIKKVGGKIIASLPLRRG